MAVEQFTREHSFGDNGNFCTVCGYTKPTSTATPVPTSTPTATPTATTAPTMPAASDEPIATAKPNAAPTAVSIVEPTFEPTVEPTAVPASAPVYTEVAASEVVHGVKAEDETPMAETMMAVAKALEAQGGTTITRIVNIDKIILPEEMAALEVLPMREQLLVFLSVIGFEEQVNAALAAEGSGLSAEAVALKEQIQSRIAAMDEAAYAEFEAALLESFPQETIEIDGVEYSFFVLELEVRTGDEVRYERYGFRMEDGAWIFTRLEIGR